MKNFLAILFLLLIGFLIAREVRNLASNDAPSGPVAGASKVEGLISRALPKKQAAPKLESQPKHSPRWQFADGSSIDAVMIAADAKNAQLRLLKTQKIHTLKLDLFAKNERERIEGWIEAKGRNGVAGFPIPVKNHRWPDSWRGEDLVKLQPAGKPNHWRSPHFDLINKAGINQSAIESIAGICESVDGALQALPLPLPLNWGRPDDSRRKIIIEESMESPNETGFHAGYWDGRTGFVHINAEYLFENDAQLVVFEFNKPQKRQKFDSIVHEVTHQSTAALTYLNIPAWVSEGLAEYMAAMQQAPSVYYFTNTHTATRYHINKLLLGDRIIKDRKMHLTFLENLMNRDLRQWNAVADADGIAGRLQYDESLLLVDYFFHDDHPNGLYFRRYLESVLTGVPEEEARSRYLMRGRSYRDLEAALIKRWKGSGFTINFQGRGELRPGDALVDVKAEGIKRSMAARRAFSGK